MITIRFRQQPNDIFGPGGIFLQHAVNDSSTGVVRSREAPHFHDSLQQELNPFARRNVIALWIEPSGSVPPGGGGQGSRAAGGRLSATRAFCAAPISTTQVRIPLTCLSPITYRRAFVPGPSTPVLVASISIGSRPPCRATRGRRRSRNPGRGLYEPLLCQL